MRFSSFTKIVYVGLVLVIACGEDTVTTLPETSSTAATGETGEPTSGGDAPTSGGGSTSADDSSGGAATMSTATVPGSTTADSVETSAGPGTEGSGESGDTGSSGDTGVEFVPCTSDEECVLIDDCCSCEPIGPGEDPPPCDLKECFTTACAPKGLEGAALQCRFGRCTFVKVTCSPTAVVCPALPPDCGGTEVPSVDEGAGCWTGQCVPAEACDAVPDCSYCAEDELICVAKLQKGPFEVCEPKPVDCGDVEDIDCTCGQQVCDASPPHSECQDTPDGIACECPFC